MKTAFIQCREEPSEEKAEARRKGLAEAQVSCAIGGTSDNDPNAMSPEYMEYLAKALASDLLKKETEANKKCTYWSRWGAERLTTRARMH